MIFPHVAHEAHVEHPVGLVRARSALDGLSEPHLLLAHAGRAGGPAWSTTITSTPRAQGLDLGPLADPAEDHRVAQRRGSRHRC